jgi:hypothetical protein
MIYIIFVKKSTNSTMLSVSTDLMFSSMSQSPYREKFNKMNKMFVKEVKTKTKNENFLSFRKCAFVHTSCIFYKHFLNNTYIEFNQKMKELLLLSDLV